MSQRESSSNIFISFSEFTRSIYIFSDDKKFLPVGKWIEGYICKSRAATTLRWKATRKGDRKKGSKEKVSPYFIVLQLKRRRHPADLHELATLLAIPPFSPSSRYAPSPPPPLPSPHAVLDFAFCISIAVILVMFPKRQRWRGDAL